MKKCNFNILSMLAVFTLFWTSSCSSNSEATRVILKSNAFIYPNLPADVGTSRDAQGNVIGTTGHFTFFNFQTGQIISLADSSSSKWDIAGHFPASMG